MTGWYRDAIEDAAYADARNSFDAYREKLEERARGAHEHGDEVEAQRLLEEARKLVYTGLQWQADNGLIEGF